METSDNRLEEMLGLLTGIAARQLSPHEIAQIWTDEHRILFRTADGRTGDVEVSANWDRGADVAQKTSEKTNYYEIAWPIP